MKSPQILAVISNGIIKAAVRQICRNEAGDALEFAPTLVRCMTGEWHPEFLILDSALLQQNQAETLERLREKIPGASILLIETVPVVNEAEHYVTLIIRASDSEESVLKNIKEFLSNAEISTSKESANQSLSEREKEIVKLVALGRTNKEISDMLFISPHTVITHRKNITAKLQIKTIAGLTVYAILNGLISPDTVS
jgi:DNA-binding CsgD family transcriptional regulator